jgi:hypothetical protein
MQIVKDDETSATEVAQYDPRKKYTWSRDVNFTLSANEFGMLLNALRGVISTPEATKILMAADAANILEEQMAKGVAEGTIIEVKE